ISPGVLVAGPRMPTADGSGPSDTPPSGMPVLSGQVTPPADADRPKPPWSAGPAEQPPGFSLETPGPRGPAYGAMPATPGAPPQVPNVTPPMGFPPIAPFSPPDPYAPMSQEAPQVPAGQSAPYAPMDQSGPNMPYDQGGQGGYVPYGQGPPPGQGPGPGVLTSAYQPIPGAEPPAGGAAGGDRRRLLIGGGVAVVLAGALVVGGITLMSGSSAAKNHNSAQAPAVTHAPVSPAPSHTPAIPASPVPTGPSINDARTDPKPLGLSEVFPSATMSLGGRDFKQDKTAVNHQCSLTARGGMATALRDGHCTNVVRATYIDSAKKVAVTVGVAVMPTKAAAQTAAKAGDPSKYEWFRGMQGKLATKIDQVGGFAASTVLGRYIIYAYAVYEDGTKPQPNDTVLKAVDRAFIDYAQRPIAKR
ncbi:MAG TPA: hypothetical protein VNW94_06635, partial [Streptosporangiaceae bacterium]|nr:hypothetical protein [Streptosporangiaceae bacterium]